MNTYVIKNNFIIYSIYNAVIAGWYMLGVAKIAHKMHSTLIFFHISPLNSMGPKLYGCGQKEAH